MRDIVDHATRIAPHDSTVLITGESGVGKERLARYIHVHSRRANGPFVAVNCGALSEGLIESELFGHVRGAFTSAVSDHGGLFETADRGTILLDEVGEMSLAAQVRLLRVLQEREVRRVGDTKQRHIDVRVIAATNKNLALHVAQQRFREDLFYRLRVVEFEVPPLRHRPEDLTALADSILARVSAQMSKSVTGYTSDALAAILRYTWPGNVRELENAIERACAFTDGAEIGLQDLPAQLRLHAVPSTGVEVRPLSEIERDYILTTLQQNRGDKRRTAEQLHIALATLFRKLKQYAPSPE